MVDSFSTPPELRYCATHGLALVGTRYLGDRKSTSGDYDNSIYRIGEITSTPKADFLSETSIMPLHVDDIRS